MATNVSLLHTLFELGHRLFELEPLAQEPRQPSSGAAAALGSALRLMTPAGLAFTFLSATCCCSVCCCLLVVAISDRRHQQAARSDAKGSWQDQVQEVEEVVHM